MQSNMFLDVQFLNHKLNLRKIEIAVYKTEKVSNILYLEFHTRPKKKKTSVQRRKKFC